MRGKPTALPDQTVLNELLSYDAETGLLTWKRRGVEYFEPSATRTAQHVCNLWNKLYAGKPALSSVGKAGYKVGTLLHQTAKAHRVIWKMTTGEDALEIDHMNGDRSDNRLSNLRSVSLAENTRNRVTPKNNTTGEMGVYRNAWAWVASYSKAGKRVHLGSFATFDEAVAARKAALKENGFLESHGRQKQVARRDIGLNA